MLERLAALEERFEELTRLMSDPEVARDYEKVAEYAKQRAEIAETVSVYRHYKQVQEEGNVSRGGCRVTRDGPH
jgi:peptide chain release factor 1